MWLWQMISNAWNVQWYLLFQLSYRLPKLKEISFEWNCHLPIRVNNVSNTCATLFLFCHLLLSVSVGKERNTSFYACFQADLATLQQATKLNLCLFHFYTYIFFCTNFDFRFLINKFVIFIFSNIKSVWKSFLNFFITFYVTMADANLKENKSLPLLDLTFSIAMNWNGYIESVAKSAAMNFGSLCHSRQFIKKLPFFQALYILGI